MRKNYTNYHSHCDFCDGRAPMEQFVAQAVACGMSAYGVTSHTTFPTPGKSLQPDTYGAYFAEFDRIKSMYNRQIELYVGLEIDYLDEVRNPQMPFYLSLPTDYTIGGVHFIANDRGEWMCTDGAFEGFKERMAQYFSNDIRRVVELFYKQSRNLVACKGYDIYAHPDKITLNAVQFYPDIINERWFEDLVVTHLRSLAGKDILVELNTKAWEQHRRLFPSIDLLPLARKLGLRMVVNSDCHEPDKVNSGRLAGLQKLCEAGYETVWEMHNYRWQECPIEL